MPQFFDLGDFALAGGARLAGARLGYATTGTLNAARDNVVLLPSYFTGTHASYAGLIGPGRALDPGRWFIVAVDMLGNGVSTSPSHGNGDAPFPPLSVADNVRAQHALLFRGLGIARITLAAGWSLGAMQALHWAMLYPDDVARVAAVCGTAFCWPINTVFLAGLAPILEAACGAAPVLPEARALAMFGRAYAGWAYSAAFFRDALYRTLGFPDLDALLADWERDHQRHRAADLLAVLRTWAAAAPPPEWRQALGRITASCAILPCDTDTYFTPEDAATEARAIPRAQVTALHSPFGHCAGAPNRFPEESAQIEAVFRDVLPA